MSKHKKFFLFFGVVLILCSLWGIVSLKKNKNHLNMQLDVENQKKTEEEGLTLLSFTKKDFPWTQGLKKDKSPIEFDLFTCPSVYSEGGKTIVRTHDVLMVDDTFPLYLSEVRDKPYRIRVEGYSQSKDNGKTIVMFKDIETEKYGECAVGDKCADLKIRVIGFDVQGYEKDGVYYEFPVATINDDILKKEIVLTNEQKFLDDEYLLVIKDFSGNEYIFSNIGDTMQIGEAACKLSSFSKKEGIAKLSLKDANGHEFNKTIHLIR
ncbi:MAG: hypothetical protein LBJ75_01930 [Puniceicoccales bacterium]|nr:hypothetical protein [Puniceicoccales bacterium]